jgi:hypothetical protein
MPGLISFEADIRALEAEMPAWAQQRIPSITRNALNDTADDARFAEVQRIRGVFDRPTPFTQNAPLYRKATKENLAAEIYIRDEASRGRAPSRVLQAEVEGGPRRAKAFEVALRRAGVMRANEFAIPAIGQQRDAFGNLPGPLITRIMSQLQAFTVAGFRANESARTRKRNIRKGTARYFVPSGMRVERGISRLPRGIYERVGGRIRAVMIFVSASPRYAVRYKFGEAAITKAGRVFGGYWQRYFYAELAKHTSRG